MRSKPIHKPSADPAADPFAVLMSSRAFVSLLIGSNGRLLEANGLARECVAGGRGEDLEALPPTVWLPRPEDRQALKRAFESSSVQSVELELGLAAGARRRVAGELYPTRSPGGDPVCIGIFRMLDDERAKPSGMERSARLEALAGLASGVAHDFNNLLTILVGNLSLVAEELRDQPKTFAKLKAARDAARRGGDLIKQLLSFARQEPVPSELIDPAKIVRKLGPLLERALGRRIRLELDLDERVDAIEGNSAQLESVIVNLAINARDAIEGEGSVRIRVAPEWPGQGDGADMPGAAPEWLRIDVSDTGSGIPLEIASRVFEPFFTTKPDGKGSGLGLAMVKSYAEQFGGSACVRSEVGSGTSIRLSFPCARGSAEESAAMTMPLAALPNGNERILLLVPEVSLSSMMQQILSMLGYQCEIAVDLAEASGRIRRSMPDLVISDGFEVGLLIGGSQSARELPCGVLMLRAVGHSEPAEAYPVLHKPFALPDLATTVREILDAIAKPTSTA